MRPGGGASKGSSFERKICKELSLAWTGGTRDDIFWRTSGSGARATVRMARGHTTAHQYGDICAVDPIGFPLTERYTFELKCGYEWEVDDLLEGKGKLVDFLGQVVDSATMARTKAVLIAKRNRRGTAVFCDDTGLGRGVINAWFRSRWWVVMPWPAFLRRAVKPNPT